MIFLGIDNFYCLNVILVSNIIFFIFGIFVLSNDFYLHNLLSITCSTLVYIALINTILMAIYAIANIWMLSKEYFDPRIRKRIRYLIKGLRIVSIMWNISQTYIMLNNLEKNGICHQKISFSYFYTFFLFIPAIIETCAVVFYIIYIVTILFILGFCYVCCGLSLSEFSDNVRNTVSRDENNDNRTEDSGLFYLNKTQIVKFKNMVGFGDEKEDICSICLDIFNDDDILRKMPCNHYYHQTCIDEWFKNHNTCPICRQNIALKNIIKE